jgi:DNA-binding CsgD family transcriptional regulator
VRADASPNGLGSSTVSLGGLPQFIEYASTYPSPGALLRALRSGPLSQRGMVGGFLWVLVDGTHLVSIANIGWSRDVVDRYSILPLELDLAAVNATKEDRSIVDSAEDFGQTYLSSLDDRFLTERFEERGAVSAVATPLRHADIVVGNLGFVTNRKWSDDDEGRALLTCLGNVIGLWATHPHSHAMDTPSAVSQREWSLAFTPRQKQILTLVGEGMSNTDIARRLIVSSSSVKQDLHQSMRALRTHSRQGAYERALSLGLLR